MESQMLGVGATLMLTGMGAVFVFLTALVGATSLMSHLVRRFEPVTSASDPGKLEEIAAIMAAIARHRNRERS